MNYKVILQEIYNESKKLPAQGKVTSSIPELEKVDPDKFGIHLTTIEEEDFGIGDSEEKFSIQSISKALTVALAFSFLDEKI
ncbi:MAG: glutaminase, partial [bacterium]|nr:glutaminase [bacterium]